MTSRLFLPGPVVGMDLVAFSGAGKNYAPNPSFDLDTNDDGLADGITTEFTDVTGTVVHELVLPLSSTSHYAQRVAYTAGAGDTAQALYLWIACGEETFAAGDVVAMNFLLKGVATGVTMTSRIMGVTAFIVPTSTATLVTAAITMAAGVASIDFAITVGEIANGDSFDITFDDLLIGKVPA